MFSALTTVELGCTWILKLSLAYLREVKHTEFSYKINREIEVTLGLETKTDV